MRLWPVLALLLPFAACADDDPEPAKVCAPGQQIECACDGGKKGAQLCAADGASYGACSCGTVGASGSAGKYEGCMAIGESCATLGCCGFGKCDSGTRKCYE